MAIPRASSAGAPAAAPTSPGTRASWYGGVQPAPTTGTRTSWAGGGATPNAQPPTAAQNDIAKAVVGGVSGAAGKMKYGFDQWNPARPNWNGVTPAAASAPAYGSQSGPTYAEDRYTSRANGTDPGWEYATGRATDQINKQYAARGGYNSSGAMNSIGDMFANATSQREGQLDQLAGAATSAHQNALNSMFTTGTNIANGVTGAGAPGTAGAGDAQTQNLRSQLDLMLAKNGVDQKTRQGQLDAIFGGTKLAASIVAAV